MQFAGTDAGIDANLGYLAELAANRRREAAPSAYMIRTYPSRVLFNLAKPREEDVRLEDIAHSLSMLCRFGGHVPFTWTVAQHSVLVAHLATCFGLEQEHYGAALMHDAHEAYMQDLTSPAKRLVGRTYTNPANDIQACIHRALGIPTLNAATVGIIKQADALALELEIDAIERGDMVVAVPNRDDEGERPWHPLTQHESRTAFLEAWERWRRE